jgi:hypothetical protein
METRGKTSENKVIMQKHKNPTEDGLIQNELISQKSTQTSFKNLNYLKTSIFLFRMLKMISNHPCNYHFTQ